MPGRTTCRGTSLRVLRCGDVASWSRRLRLAGVRRKPSGLHRGRGLHADGDSVSGVPCLFDAHRRGPLQSGPYGPHAFPPTQRGFFVAAHGSWHKTNGVYSAPPRVAFVAMNGDDPVTPVDWADPSKQWSSSSEASNRRMGRRAARGPQALRSDPEGPVRVRRPERRGLSREAAMSIRRKGGTMTDARLISVNVGLLAMSNGRERRSTRRSGSLRSRGVFACVD